MQTPSGSQRSLSDIRREAHQARIRWWELRFEFWKTLVTENCFASLCSGIIAVCAIYFPLASTNHYPPFSKSENNAAIITFPHEGQEVPMCLNSGVEGRGSASSGRKLWVAIKRDAPDGGQMIRLARPVTSFSKNGWATLKFTIGGTGETSQPFTLALVEVDAQLDRALKKTRVAVDDLASKLLQHKLITPAQWDQIDSDNGLWRIIFKDVYPSGMREVDARRVTRDEVHKTPCYPGY